MPSVVFWGDCTDIQLSGPLPGSRELAAMSRFYFALDLRDDPMLIQEYESWHKADAIWPSVIHLLRDSGVQELELYRCGNRLLQVLEVRQGHPLVAGGSVATIAQWEELMWRYQQPLPFAQPGEKWVRMNRLFSLSESL